MLYSFDKKLLGFCENKKIKSLPLYIFSDLKYLDSTDLVNVEQKRFLLKHMCLFSWVGW